MIIKQPDKSNWDSIIAHFNLNTVEADILLEYAEGRVDNPDFLTLDELEMLYFQFLGEEVPDDLRRLGKRRVRIGLLCSSVWPSWESWSLEVLSGN